MRRLLLLAAPIAVFLVVLMVGTGLAAATPLLGDPSVGSFQDNDAAGLAEAFQFRASASGDAQSISVYVDSGSRAGGLAVGVYADNSGHPGSLLASGSTSALVAGAWNDVTLNSTPTLSSGTSYWLAVLGTGGQLNFRDVNLGTGSCSESSSRSDLTSLPVGLDERNNLHHLFALCLCERGGDSHHDVGAGEHCASDDQRHGAAGTDACGHERHLGQQRRQLLVRVGGLRHFWRQLREHRRRDRQRLHAPGQRRGSHPPLGRNGEQLGWIRVCQVGRDRSSCGGTAGGVQFRSCQPDDRSERAFRRQLLDLPGHPVHVHLVGQSALGRQLGAWDGANARLRLPGDGHQVRHADGHRRIEQLGHRRARRRRHRRTDGVGAVEHRAAGDQRHRHPGPDADHEQRQLERQPDGIRLPVAPVRRLGQQLHEHHRRHLEQLHARDRRRRPHRPRRRHRHQRRRLHPGHLRTDQRGRRPATAPRRRTPRCR